MRRETGQQPGSATRQLVTAPFSSQPRPSGISPDPILANTGGQLTGAADVAGLRDFLDRAADGAGQAAVAHQNPLLMRIPDWPTAPASSQR